ncbi:MAG: hypothetical protein GXO62_02615 [Epsilonproteobacteria bacterium]|nr:hypothetical protein [Campylobacterota bacterium]
MDYRDPLFSVIAFFTVILLAAVLSAFFGKIREIIRSKEIEKLLEDFEFIEIENIPLNRYSTSSLLMLAKAYEVGGEYEKALKIYLLIQKREDSLVILKNIARLYFKAGFLQKAKKVVYKVLKVKPRDKEALRQLILIDEKLAEYKEIVDILEIFDTLESELPKEKAYALIKLFLSSGCNIEDFCKGINDFGDIYAKYPFVRREYVEYLFKTNPNKAYEILDVYEDLDLYFNRNDIPNTPKFCNVLAAKKVIKCPQKAPFEIEALKHLPDGLGEIEFEYVCQNCKKIFPIYSSRCVNCGELFCLKTIPKLSPKEEIKEIEF